MAGARSQRPNAATIGVIGAGKESVSTYIHTLSDTDLISHTESLLGIQIGITLAAIYTSTSKLQSLSTPLIVDRGQNPINSHCLILLLPSLKLSSPRVCIAHAKCLSEAELFT